jgi:hypothetical protein
MSSLTKAVTVETLPVIAYQGVRVLTTELLAQLYGTDDKNIHMNFSNNVDRFVAGKHFFKLEGEELKEFKRLSCPNDIGSPLISPFARNLTLWTERGAARHAKILDTDAAWDVFEQLENAYFNPRESASKPTDPIIGALVHGLMEIDAIKQQNARMIQQQADLDRKTELLENRVQNVELQHRNGVPDGYLSKKEAHHLYGVGLSEEIFECLLVKVGVTSKRYMHIAEGYKTPSTAYLEAEIQPAVEAFLEDAVQCSAVFCMSPMLDGKRFRYVKEAFSKGEAA